MDVRIDETRSYPATAAVDDSLELAAILPREHICCQTDICDPIANDDDRGVANDRVSGIDGQREFEMLNENTHGRNHCTARDLLLVRRADRLLNFDEIVGIRDIGE